MKNLISTIVFSIIAVVTISAQETSILNISDIEDAQNEIVLMTVNIDNGATQVIAFQMDIVMPSAIIAINDEYGCPNAQFTTRANKTYILTADYVNDDVIRIVAFSNKNVCIEGTEGAIITLPVKLVGEVGVYEIKITNALVTDSDRIEHEYLDSYSTVKITSEDSVHDIMIDQDMNGLRFDILGRESNSSFPGIYLYSGNKIYIR